MVESTKVKCYLIIEMQLKKAYTLNFTRLKILILTKYLL